MRVIAKAYGGAPLQREVVSSDERLVFVVNPSLVNAVANVESTAVGFRRETVFPYRDGLFADLRAAFDSGDASALEREWARAGQHL